MSNLKSFFLVQGCAPIGIANSVVIPDSSFSSSTYYDNRYISHNARLNTTLYGWGPNVEDKASCWLQVDLLAMYTLCAIATQGCSGNTEWATRYNVKFSKDGSSWSFYSENGKTKVSNSMKAYLYWWNEYI